MNFEFKTFTFLSPHYSPFCESINGAHPTQISIDPCNYCLPHITTLGGSQNAKLLSTQHLTAIADIVAVVVVDPQRDENIETCLMA